MIAPLALALSAAFLACRFTVVKAFPLESNVMAAPPFASVFALNTLPERLPLSVIAPPDVTVKFPVSANAAKSTAVVSTKVTLAIDPLEAPKLSVPVKALEALSSVMDAPLETVKLELPVTDTFPLSEMFPPAVIVNPPDTVDAARSMALVSINVTLFPVVIPTVEKLFVAVSKVMLLPLPAASVVVPVTAKAPLSVIAPLEVTLKVPDTVEAAKSMALVSTNVTLFPVVIPNVEKLFVAVSSVMLLPEPAANVVVPVTARAPLSVIAPEAVAVRAPPTVVAPKTSAPLLVNVAAPAPVEVIPNAPTLIFSP